MKRINIRHLQRNLYSAIKEIPFVVTRDGSDSLVVLPYDERIVSYYEALQKRDEERVEDLKEFKQKRSILDILRRK